MIKLRTYQEEAVENALQMLSDRGNSLIVAGTGAGKTIMMAATIGRYYNTFFSEHGKKPHVLVLVHRNEIHLQNHDKFSLVCPNIQTSEITSSKKSLHGNVHFGMVQTVRGLLDEFERAGSFFDLIVIDEAHHSKASCYEEIIEWNNKGKPNCALFGVTATPNRGDKLPLIHLFDNFYQIPTRFLIESHFLVRPRFVDLSPVFDLEKGKEIGHLGKNIKEDEAGNELLAHLCKEFINRKEAGKSIIFAPSHSFCRRIYDILTQMGRNCAYLSEGLDEASRKAELLRFEKGDCDELINVDICTEGYDFPPLRNLVDFDTNGTQGQWVQKVGRVLRTAPNKTSCTVIDFGGNIELYPDGVETDVNLYGAMKNPKGKRLASRDLFAQQEKPTADCVTIHNELFSPYHLPEGFESVLDNIFGIVYVACGSSADTIIVKNKNNEEFFLFCSDKRTLIMDMAGDFDPIMKKAVSLTENIEHSDREISKMQIKFLAPEYPTMTLDWYGANCTLCFKAWKKEITDMLSLWKSEPGKEAKK